jgi:hypothetical protein
MYAQLSHYHCSLTMSHRLLTNSVTVATISVHIPINFTAIGIVVVVLSDDVVVLSVFGITISRTARILTVIV